MYPSAQSSSAIRTGTAGGTSEGVVGQADKFIVVLSILPQTPQRDRHAFLKITMQTGLGHVILLKIVEELLGRAGKRQLLRASFIGFPNVQDFLFRWFVCKRTVHGGKMAV